MSRITPGVRAALLGFGLGALVVAPVRVARADEATASDYQTLLSKGQQFLRSEQYTEALKEFAAAYALRQAPLLLYYQGLAHQKLGHAKEALELYGRYLSAGGPDDAAERRALTERIETLKRVEALTAPPPPAPAANLPFRVETRNHHRGMIAAGWAMLSVGYAFAFGTGVAFAVIGRRTEQAAGGTLLIPVAGPLISSAVWYEAILPWGLPWLLTDLPLQISGLALLIQGYNTKQRVIVPSNEGTEVRLRPYASPDGIGMIAVGRF